MTATGPEWNVLWARVEKLERANRRMKVAGALMLVLAGVGLLTGSAGPSPPPGPQPTRTVEADEFALRDEAGRRRAVLSMVRHSPALVLSDDKGIPRIALAVSRDGPGLTLRDENGKPSVNLHVTKELGSLLSFVNERGIPRVAAGVGRQGPTLTLSDRNGTPRAVLGCTEARHGITGQTYTKPESSLTLCGEDGAVVFAAPAER